MAVLNNSGDFEQTQSDHLDWTPGGAGDTQQLTANFWLKLESFTVFAVAMSAFNGATGVDDIGISFANNRAVFTNVGNGTFRTPTGLITDNVWHNVHVQYDLSQAQDEDKVKIWVNGNEETITVQAAPSSSTFDHWLKANTHLVGAREQAGGEFNHIDGLMAGVYFLDGILEPVSSFYSGGSPVDYTGSYGTNGFQLLFENGSNLGEDASGNNNDFTNNGVTQSTDVPPAGLFNDAKGRLKFLGAFA